MIDFALVPKERLFNDYPYWPSESPTIELYLTVCMDWRFAPFPFPCDSSALACAFYSSFHFHGSPFTLPLFMFRVFFTFVPPCGFCLVNISDTPLLSPWTGRTLRIPLITAAPDYDADDAAETLPAPGTEIATAAAPAEPTPPAPPTPSASATLPTTPSAPASLHVSVPRPNLAFRPRVPPGPASTPRAPTSRPTFPPTPPKHINPSHLAPLPPPPLHDNPAHPRITWIDFLATSSRSTTQ